MAYRISQILNSCSSIAMILLVKCLRKFLAWSIWVSFTTHTKFNSHSFSSSMFFNINRAAILTSYDTKLGGTPESICENRFPQGKITGLDTNCPCQCCTNNCPTEDEASTPDYRKLLKVATTRAEVEGEVRPKRGKRHTAVRARLTSYSTAHNLRSFYNKWNSASNLTIRVALLPVHTHVTFAII